MQKPSKRRSNRDRTEATRTALAAAARRLFVKKGYAGTGTPEIVTAAKVTRGALYHHFASKEELFLDVARQAADEVAREVAEHSHAAKSPLEALALGSEAYFAAMAAGGRARLLLLDAPTVLGPRALLELSERAGAKELRQGLEAAVPARLRETLPLDELTAIVSAAFDRAALAIASGQPAPRYVAALRFLLERLAAPDAPVGRC
jgi:AcrR family transcriptional regulator